MTFINVSAKAEHFQQPERAILKINIKVERKEKQEASELARNAANQVSAIFKARHQTSQDGKVLETAPITWFSCGSLTVSFFNFYFGNKSEKKEERCSANVGLQAKFKDFEELSNVISLLTPIPHVEIRSIDWTITDLTRASLQSNLRKKAVKDAQNQAQDFASALGLQTIKCVEIQAGSGNHYGGNAVYASRAAAPMMSKFGAPGGGQEEGLDLKPEDVEIGCHLNAKFEAS